VFSKATAAATVAVEEAVLIKNVSTDYRLDDMSVSVSGVLEVRVNGQTWAVARRDFTTAIGTSVCRLFGRA